MNTESDGQAPASQLPRRVHPLRFPWVVAGVLAIGACSLLFAGGSSGGNNHGNSGGGNQGNSGAGNQGNSGGNGQGNSGGGNQGGFVRTPQKLAHEQFIVGGIIRGLTSYLRLAQTFGRWQHLVPFARNAWVMLGFTIPSDPYRPDESTHLEHARQRLSNFVAVSNPSAESLAPHYIEVQEAIDFLEHVRTSLSKERGNH